MELGALQGGTWNDPGSPNRKHSEPPPAGFLCRIHYIGMIDELIGHW